MGRRSRACRISGVIAVGVAALAGCSPGDEAEAATAAVYTSADCGSAVEFPEGYPVEVVPLVTCDATVRDDVVNDTFVYVVRLEGDGVIAEQTALLEDTGWTLEAIMPWSDDSSGTKPYLQGAAPLDGWDVDITARPEGNEHAPDADVMDIFVFESD